MHNEVWGCVEILPHFITGLLPRRQDGVVFFFFFLSWLLAPDLRSVKTILAGNLGSFSVISPEFS